MTRVTSLVIAPPAPVAWSPGTPPLSDSLRSRVLAGAGAERAISVMPASGRRVVSVPVGMTPPDASDGPRRPITERVVIPVTSVPRAAPASTPWAVADPVPGVVARTSVVPADWLRPPVSPSRRPVAAVVAPPVVRPGPRTPTHAPRPTPRHAERALPASVRIRRAAVMAFGLLVSLVAVEAAARVGRR
jgi:hypothetical protein